MKYLPSAVLSADLDIASEPFFGGEFKVLLTTKPAILVGEIDLMDSANGAFTAHAGLALPLNTNGVTGADLQMVASTYLTSAVVCVVTLNVLDENLVARTATATFAPPSRETNQDTNMERGYAVDIQLVPGVGLTGVKISSVVSVAGIVGGYRNVSFLIFQLPEAAAYTLVGETTTKKFSTKARKGVGVNSGMKTDAFVKAGMEEPGELSIDCLFGGMSNRMAKFSGAKCTALLIGTKDGQVTTDQLVFTQYRPTVNIDAGTGESEAVSNAATGKFVEPLFFVAP